MTSLRGFGLRHNETGYSLISGRWSNMAKQKSEKSEKKSCPISKEDFLKNVKALDVVVNGVPMAAVPKEFSTGSFGWYLNGKTTIKVGDTAVEVNLGFNLTVIGSKPETKE